MKSLVFTLFAALFLNACGELSYKRGANVADLEKAKQSCQSKDSDAATEKCLEDNGWTVQKLGSFEVFSETTIKNEPAKAEAVTPLTEASTSEASPSNATVNQKTLSDTNTPPPPIQKKSVISDPLDTFIVPSWWKTGVNPDSFTKDSNACVAKLGEAHKPDGKTQTVTAGFIVCMRENGWKAIKKFK